MKPVQTTAAPAAIGPYSQGMIWEKLVFTAGQIPLSADGKEIVGTEIAAQTQQVIKNLQGILEAAGSSLTGVIKTTCFLADMGDFAAFNEVYEKHFTGKPARSTVAVKGLPKNVLVEIEAVAVIG
ncbi:MAG: RidA family protein [Spirochaetes bacterium]|nr:RidA family protein [Spirochaetota bacterium]